ncbi:MAG: response regulator transcription factor [Verrucomicrobiae bacterium]|nr:response regulator transcription factor [Verrucomicrobiae bacterium]
MGSSLPTVLVIDDEVAIRRLLRAALQARGWRVLEAENGNLGMSEVALGRPDAVVLDLGLPDMDGVDVVRRLRDWSRIPILVVSVRDSAEEKVKALDAGADDYVSKPFNTEELLARLRAIQRRGDPALDGPEFVCGPLRIDFAARDVSVGGQRIALTPIEYTVLKSLARNAGKVVTQRQLLREIWGPKGDGYANHLRVHMAHLRTKLADAGFDRGRLQTEPRVGYRLLE